MINWFRQTCIILSTYLLCLLAGRYKTRIKNFSVECAGMNRQRKGLSQTEDETFRLESCASPMKRIIGVVCLLNASRKYFLGSVWTEMFNDLWKTCWFVFVHVPVTAAHGWFIDITLQCTRHTYTDYISCSFTNFIHFVPVKWDSFILIILQHNFGNYILQI